MLSNEFDLQAPFCLAEESVHVVPPLLNVKLGLQGILKQNDQPFKNIAVTKLMDQHLSLLLKYLRRRLCWLLENQSPLVSSHLGCRMFILESYNLLQQYTQLGTLISCTYEANVHDLDLLKYSASKLSSQFLKGYISMVRALLDSYNDQSLFQLPEKFFGLIIRCCTNMECIDSTPVLSNECTQLIHCLRLHSLPEFAACFHKKVKQEIQKIEAMMSEFACEYDSLSQKSRKNQESTHGKYYRPQFTRLLKSYMPLTILFSAQVPLIIEWSYRGLYLHFLWFFRLSTLESKSGTHYLKDNKTDIFGLFELLRICWNIIMDLQSGSNERIELFLKEPPDSVNRGTFYIGNMKKMFSSTTLLRRFMKKDVLHPSTRTRTLVKYLVTFSEALENAETTLLLKFLVSIIFLIQIIHVPNGKHAEISCKSDLLLATPGAQNGFFAVLDILSFSSQSLPDKHPIVGAMHEFLINMQKEISSYIHRRQDGQKEILSMTIFKTPENPLGKSWNFIVYLLFHDFSSASQTQLCLDVIYDALAEMLLQKFFDFTDKLCTFDGCYRYKNELIHRFEFLLTMFNQKRPLKYRNEKQNWYFGNQDVKTGDIMFHSQEKGSSSLKDKQIDLDSALQQDEPMKNLSFTIRKCIVMISDFGKALESRISIEETENKNFGHNTYACFPISHYYWPAKFSYVYDAAGSLQSVCLLDSATWVRRYPLLQIDSLTYPNNEFFVPIEKASFFISLKKSSGGLIRLKVSELQLLALKEMQRSGESYFYHNKIAKELDISPECLYNSLRPLLTNGILGYKVQEGLQENSARACDELYYYIS